MASAVAVELRGTDREHRVLRRALVAWRYGPYAASVEAIEREAALLAVATDGRAEVTQHLTSLDLTGQRAAP